MKYILYAKLFLTLALTSQAHSEHKVFHFNVEPKAVQYAGETRKAISINGQIPGPTLHVKEGDLVTVYVHNKLDEGTSIHWHGLLIPWEMDGVVGVTQDPIPPGETFKYEYTVKQSGTYWYHSHKGLQEQLGLYGTIIIDPLKPEPYEYTKDFPIVMSDWTNTSPYQVFDNLKKSGDYYTSKMPIQPSLSYFLSEYQKAPSQEAKDKLIASYNMMQTSRMSVFDFSDVAYDAYLLNGHSSESPWMEHVQVGDSVRLRFIGAGTSTIYHIKIPNEQMQVVHIQGKDVSPYYTDSFTLAPGETLDVIVKIKEDKTYIIYAESNDTLGRVLGILATHPDQINQLCQVEPFPTPGPISMGHSMKGHEESGEHGIPTETVGTKYQDLKADYKTNDPNRPFEVIEMALQGDMDRYIWLINGLPEYLAEPVTIEHGKRYRLIFTNHTMMHHPLHIHGHFLILRNGHGEYDPYLHTIDVAPGSTVVADLDADTEGQWYFHCHHLYHMVAGMARVFRYSDFQEDYFASHKPAKLCLAPTPDYIKKPQGHGASFFSGTRLDIGYDPYRNVQKGTFYSLIGTDYHRLQLYSEDAEINKGKVEDADLDIFYWHPISKFWAIKGGANYYYRPTKHPYWQPGVGIEGIIPYFINTDLRTYLHRSSVKADLQISRNTQLLDNFFVNTGFRFIAATKTVKRDEIGSGLNDIEYIVRPYIMITPRIALFTEFNYTRYYGPRKKILRRMGESPRERTITIGTSLLF